MRNIIRYVANKQDLEIELINEPLLIYIERKDSGKNGDSFLLIFIYICFRLILANFFTIIIREKENNSKHL